MYEDTLVTLNIFNPAPLGNTVYTLDNLTKAQIIKALNEALSADQCWLGRAESIAQIDQVNPDTLTTAREWLEERCIEWNKSDRRKFEIKIASLFRGKYNRSPIKADRPGSEGSTWKKAVSVYDPDKDRLLFKEAYEYVVRQQPKVATEPKVEANI